MPRAKRPRKGFHPLTEALLAKRGVPSPGRKTPARDCPACGGKGRNSKGGACYPCLIHGRIPSR